MNFPGFFNMHFLTIASLLFLTVGPSSQAYDFQKEPAVANQAVPEIEGLNLDQKNGVQIDLTTQFRNEAGQLVPLSTYFDGVRPVLLTIVYYGCPNLCNYHLNGLSDVMKKMDLDAGKDYRFVAVSMDPKEEPPLASEKKQNLAKAIGREDALLGWHFLVDYLDNTRKLADSVGFKYRWVESEQQFAHPAVAYVMTPHGRVSKYMTGIEFSPQTLRLALVEASKGQIGNLVDQFLLFCFHFDPNKSKYTIYAFNIMRLAAIFIVLVLLVILLPAWRREVKAKTE